METVDKLDQLMTILEKLFYSSLMLRTNKLDHLSLTSLQSMVQSFKDKATINGAPLRQDISFVTA